MPRGKARSDKDLATANGLFCYGTVFIDPNSLSHGIHHARADSHLVGCQQSGNASWTSTTSWRLPSPGISRHSSSNLKRRNRIDR
jgi:hypothetical protein